MARSGAGSGVSVHLPMSQSETGGPDDATVREAALRTTVLIPTYLRPKMLLKCVETILAGSHRPEEIVVVGREGDRQTREAIAAIEAAPHAGVTIRSAWVTEPGTCSTGRNGSSNGDERLDCHCG